MNIEKQELISIIVPIYNTEKYLRNCIDSIICQTYQNMAIYLIDDGSTDGSPMICDEYAKKDTRIVVIHKKNEGQGVARNVALNCIKCGYIAFVDSDDYIEPMMFEKMVTSMQENKADISICGIRYSIKGKDYENSSLKQETIYSNEELIKEYISTPNIFTGMVNKVYKSELFAEIRFPSLRANEDAFILPDLLKKCGRAVHIGECVYIQRIRGGSTENSSFSRNNLALITVAEKLISFVLEYYPQFYHFVVAKKIEDIVYLMKRILVASSYHKCKSDYKSLSKTLKLEYRLIKEQYPQSIKKETRLAAEHELLFKLKCLFQKIKLVIKRMIRI